MMTLATRFRPEQIDPSAFIAPNATILGDVTIERLASVWCGAVIRGDTERISLGERTNVQDGCILHADPGCPCTIGRGVTVGHRAIVHGATVHDDVIIGMGAILLSGVTIESDCIIGAGSVIPEGRRIPAGSLVLGVPGTVVRQVGEEHRQMIRLSAEDYERKAQAFKDSLSNQSKA
jgi:carbonic anhydrase/acetyltransferase-like protein (isoleucine patch superfamily)